MRAVLASAAIALVLSLFGTPLYIRFLVKRGYGQFIRDDGPTTHHTKRGTPTMGGAVIIVATLLAYVVAHVATLTPPTMSGVLVLFLMTGLGVVGFLDDFIKISQPAQPRPALGAEADRPVGRGDPVRRRRAAVPERRLPHPRLHQHLGHPRHRLRPRLRRAPSSGCCCS